MPGARSRLRLQPDDLDLRRRRSPVGCCVRLRDGSARYLRQSPQRCSGRITRTSCAPATPARTSATSGSSWRRRCCSSSTRSRTSRSSASGSPGSSAWEYVIFIFSGLVPYLMTAEALVTGVTSVIANKSVLNNTVFPIDLAPVKAVLTSQATMLVGMTVTLVGGRDRRDPQLDDRPPARDLAPECRRADRRELVPVAPERDLPRHPELPDAGADDDADHLADRVYAGDRPRQPQAADPAESVRLLRRRLPAGDRARASTRARSTPSLLVLLAVVPFVAGSWFFASAKRVIVDYV